MRIYQLAKDFHVDSQEIRDALEDMGVTVKSNLAKVDDAIVDELRGLFKPKPKPARSVKEDAVRRALEERESREQAARDAILREEERKANARKAALERAAAKRAALGQEPIAESAEAPSTETTKAETEVEAAAPEVSAPESPAPSPPPGEQSVEPSEQPAAAASKDEAAPTKKRSTGRPEPRRRPTRPPMSTDTGSAPARPSQMPGGLGKAVIAPPPSTAKEAAAMLGRPLHALRPQRPAGAAPATAPPPSRQAPPGAYPSRPSRPGGGARPGGAPPRRSAASRRKKKEKLREKRQAAAEAAAQKAEAATLPVGEIEIFDGILVKELAERMNRNPTDIIKRLFLDKKMMATINHALDEATATWVIEAFEGTAKVVGMEEEAVREAEELGVRHADEDHSHRRAPVVTMMGHVDHGKTSLLDAIRETRVAEREAGGITQHIGAYKIQHTRPEGETQDIVFLDTPGHAAFTMMRARGAKVTDVVILVVAADDGVMPQTIEAIQHAEAADAPLIIAINKCDLEGANPDRVLQQLAERNVLVEDYGGDVVACRVSAKTGEGIDHLLEMILLVTEIQELGASPENPATGVVLEARLDKAKGSVATVLVQNGTLHVGDVFAVGCTWGRVRALFNEHNEQLTAVGPSTPVLVTGLNAVPAAGDTLQVFPDDQKARQIALYRQQQEREDTLLRHAMLPSLERLHSQIAAGQVQDLHVIVKADVQGSVEVLKKSISDLSTKEMTVRVIRDGTGAITENDVLLASANKAIVVGFNVRPERGVRDLAEREGVDIRLHRVIYHVTDEIKTAMIAALPQVEQEEVLGRAVVREVFKISKVGTIAGSYVLEGVIKRNASARLLRDNVVIHEGKIESLRRFKDDAREVRSGFECGISLERYQDLKPGDEIEAFEIKLEKRDSL